MKGSYMSNRKLRMIISMVAAFSMAAVVTPLATMSASAASSKVIVDFESGAGYSLSDFGNETSSVVTDAPNNATSALKSVRGTETWSGVTFFNKTGTVLINDKHLIVTADVNAPSAGKVVRLKLENAGDPGQSVETNATEPTVTGWHTYTFDLGAQANGTAAYNSAFTYDKATMFFDFGSTASGDTYYADNITFPGAPTTEFAVDFESADGYALSDFGNQVSSVVTDAPTNATHALKSVRGTETWSGVTFFNKANTVLISDGNLVVTADINAPSAGVELRMKLENGLDNTMTVETTTTSVAGWHNYSFNFANQATGTAAYKSSSTYDKATLFFDFGGSARDTYYADNIIFPGGVAVVVPKVANATLATFESGDAASLDVANKAGPTHTLGVFGGDNNQAVISTGPAGGKGGNTLKVTKLDANYTGINVFADETSTLRYTNADHPVVSFNYYAPHAGPVVVELNPGQVQATAQAVAGWQTISLDFSQGTTLHTWSSSANYNKVSIFPDFLVTSAGDNFYFDDVAVNGGVTPHIDSVPPTPAAATSTLITFENNDVAGNAVAGLASDAHPLGVFGGANNKAEIVAGPARGNMSMVLGVTKAGEAWTGVNLLKDTSGTVRYTNADHPQVSFNYYAPHAGPVVVELDPGAVQVTAQAVAGWQTITVDFSTSNAWHAATEYNTVVLFPDFLVASAGDVFYFDNVAVNGAVTPAVLPIPVASKPVNTVASSLSGTAKVGKTLTAVKGTWTGYPAPTVSYKWYRCSVVGKTATNAAPAKAAKCSVINGKTAATYKLVAADKGKFIRASVIATNSEGTTIKTTKTTAKAVVK
jgi:hypothetical protein